MTEISETTVYCVATPIGNLGDLSTRAREVLSSVDLILSEDTRVTQRLLSACSLPPKTLWRLNEHQQKIPENFLNELLGKKIALTVDAGTPGISDPAAKFLDQLIKFSSNTTVKIIPIAGPSAVTAALSVSAMGRDGFVFLGFPAKSPGKFRKEIAQALDFEKAVIFYESPYRITKTMNLLASSWPTLRVCLCRELTKQYEEILRGSAQEMAQELSARKKILGEIVVVIEQDRINTTQS